MIILPDIHGRSFWKSALEKKNDDEKIIFLGDYLDPYSWEGFTRKDALEGFKEIIEVKKGDPESIILLIGNHDYQYITEDPKSRYDYDNAEEIRRIFIDNQDLFQLALMNGDVLYSHSGIWKTWVEAAGMKDLSLEEIVLSLNNRFLVDPASLESILLCVSRYRYGWSNVGSCIWGDIHDVLECPDEEYEGVYQIFGHTQQKSDPVIKDSWACLDCRKAFRISENHKIEEI